MRKIILVALLVGLALYAGYNLQEDYDPIVAEPAVDIVETEPVVQNVSHVQYASESTSMDLTQDMGVASVDIQQPSSPPPPDVVALDPEPTGLLSPQYIDKQITCDSFSSQSAAQAFLDANPKSAVTLDVEDDGYACSRGNPSPVPVIRQDGPTYPPPHRNCYPSCQYELLQQMTPDEREAIGAARDMPKFTPPKGTS
jgi:hypothetical protein